MIHRLRAWKVGRRELCRAVHLVNDIVYRCHKKSEHFGCHCAKYWITSETYGNRPLWKSRVVLRWTPWQAN